MTRSSAGLLQNNGETHVESATKSTAAMENMVPYQIDRVEYSIDYVPVERS